MHLDIYSSLRAASEMEAPTVDVQRASGKYLLVFSSFKRRYAVGANSSSMRAQPEL